MDVVKLKNGAEEVAALVTTTMMTLTRLLHDNPIAAVDAVGLARDRGYDASFTLSALKDLALVRDDGTMHSSIRNIIASAAKGEGLELELVNPRA